MAGRLALAGNAAGTVVNQGRISATSGGYVVLVGAQVVNDGSVTAPLGDVRRLELFDIKDKAVIVALRQTGLEITHVSDGLHAQDDASNSSDPLHGLSSQSSRRRHFIHRVGADIVEVAPGTSLIPLYMRRRM